MERLELDSEVFDSIKSRQFYLTFVPALLLLLILAFVAWRFQIEIPLMTRDTAAIAKLHPFAGALSVVGSIFWSAAVSVSLFSAVLVKQKQRHDIFRFLFCSALLSLYLLLDDTFQLHEEIAGRYLNIDEGVVFAVLGTAVAFYLLFFWRVIATTRWIFLLFALGFFAVSVAMDTILGPWLWRLRHWQYFFEDGFKWLGIASWCSYHVTTAAQYVQKEMEHHRR